MKSSWIENLQETIVAEGVKIRGQLAFQGVLKYAGTFEGDIYTPDKLIVLETGVIKANIEADTIIIAGKVFGIIRAKSKIQILATGYLKGSIVAPILTIDEGGIFFGDSTMSATESQV